MKIAKERVIYNNYDLTENYSDEDIIEMLIENEQFSEDERDEITDHNIWEERHYLDECDWDNAKETLERVFNKCYKLVCVGSVGRWDGVYSGKFYFNTLDELLSNATKDCDYIKFYDVNGHLYLHCSHHDGSCQFEIKEVTEKGYTRLLRIAEREWGCPSREYEEATKENIKNKLNNEARSFYC